jgi:hypothetical protein
MRSASVLIAAIFLLPVAAYASPPLDVEDLAHHPFTADFPSGGQLQMHVRSAEVHIVGSDQKKVEVSVGGRRGSDSDDMKAHFNRIDDSGDLRITGGPSSEVIITIRVPRNSDLRVHIFAGAVDVKDIQGNKDIELGAGDLTIGVGDPADYFHVEASVTSGAIDAPPFGESRGGFFRSFKRSGKGKYKLVAHVGAGDLTMQ